MNAAFQPSGGTPTGQTASDQLLDAMAQAGIVYDDKAPITGDGKLHRFHVAGDAHGDRNGWYCFHDDAMPAGNFGCMKRYGPDKKLPFSAKRARPLRQKEKGELQAKHAAQKAKREAETKAKRAAAAVEAKAIWAKATPVGEDSHPYLLKKGIQAHGACVNAFYARQPQADGSWANVLVSDNALLIPRRSYQREIVSLQAIFPNADNALGRDRTYLSGGETKGTYETIGQTQYHEGCEVFLLCEGFATGAALHETTGHCAVVAFDAGNLIHVARRMRDKCPEALIIIAADNDQWTTQPVENPGLHHAKMAAKAVKGRVMCPVFPANTGTPYPETGKLKGPTDFDDLRRLHGDEAVREVLEACLNAPQSPDNGPQGPTPGAVAPALPSPDSEEKMATAGHGAGDETVSSSTSLVVVNGEWETRKSMVHAILEGTLLLGSKQAFMEVSRPGFSMHPGHNPFGAPGLLRHIYRKGRKGEEEDERVADDIWVSSPLEVVANTHDEYDSNYGKRVRFRNRAGRWRTWAIPMELLTSRNMNDICQELLKQGVTLSTERDGAAMLMTYLMETDPKHWLVAATRTGWHEEPGHPRHAFVLPDRTIGCQDVVFQSATGHPSGFGEKGSLVDWQREVAAYCTDNTILQAAVCVALAGPLIRTFQKPVGIHFVGPTSVGKSTALAVASSVWGSGSAAQGFMRTWKSTQNGLEAIAAERNDTFLPLDEIGEANEKDIGKAVYALSNGIGKVRANVHGKARETATWRVATLSTGESSLDTLMGRQGEVPRGGQEVRLLNVPIVRQHGIFDTLHGLSDGGDLSRHLQRASTRSYGLLGPAFIEALCQIDPEGYEAFRQAHRKASELIADGATEGFVQRAADALAVAAIAGEFAIDRGLLPWAANSAVSAMGELFQRWLEERGDAHSEERKVLDAIEGFITAHADSRFSGLHESPGRASSPTPVMVRDRAGWWMEDAGRWIYLLTPAGMREAVKPTGIDLSRAAAILDDAGWITAKDKKRFTKKKRIPGHGVLNCYWLCPASHLTLHQGQQVAP